MSRTELPTVGKNHKLSSCCPQASFGPLTEEGQATCIVTSGGEPKGAEVGLRLNLRLLGNIGDQSSSGLMGRPTFLVGAPTIDDRTAATCNVRGFERDPQISGQ